jgi:F-type H+-transporting ATPase subunit beta
VREALVALWSGGGDERARKLANYLTQPFFCAEPWTRQPGSHVGLAEALDDCSGILDGRFDDLPVDDYYFGGSMRELRARRTSP